MRVTSPTPDHCGDATYEAQLEAGPVEFCAHLGTDDAAFVLGACAERGVPLEEAVVEALVNWAAA